MRKHYEIALGLLAASAFWAVIFVWQSNLNPSRSQEYPQPTVAPQQNSHPSPLAANAKQPAQGHKEGKWYDKFLDHLPDWFVAMFTGLLVYVTFRLVKATSDLRDSTDKLWEAGERQIAVAQSAASAAHKSADIAKLSADATMKAADAATVSADAAMKSVAAAINSERPLLFVKIPELESDATTLRCKISIVNIGRTPAILRNKAVRFGQLYNGSPIYGKGFLLHEKILHEREEIEDFGAGILHESLKKGESVIVGRITYSDVFGIERVMGFCFGWPRRKGKVMDRLERVGGARCNYDRVAGEEGYDE